MLRGRQDECAVIDGMLEDAREGRSGVLVLRAEAGVGKTALLDYAIRSAGDLWVLRAVGVEAEMELPFAALHQLCGPLLDRLDGLPGPQREALATTFGLSAGAVPALSAQVWKCMVSVGPMLSRTRKTWALDTRCASCGYRLLPPCSINPKWKPAVLAIA